MDRLRILTCGSKRLITLLAPLLLSAWAQGAYADSVPTFTVQTNIATSISDTSSALYTYKGPGINLGTVDSSVSCDWDCGEGPTSLTPGSSLKPEIFISPNFGGEVGSVTLDGQQIDCTNTTNCSLGSTEITPLSSIKFPTNDQSFTITLPAVINGTGGGPPTAFLFSPTLPGGEQMINLETSPGRLMISFAFFDTPSPFYEFAGATFSNPEPGTLGLMAAGLAGILGLSKRRKLQAH